MRDRKKQRELRRLHGDKPYPYSERSCEYRRDPTADRAIYLADRSAATRMKPRGRSKS